jgi:hypothetical protein
MTKLTPAHLAALRSVVEFAAEEAGNGRCQSFEARTAPGGIPDEPDEMSQAIDLAGEVIAALEKNDPPPAVCSLIQLAREAPADDPGEGYWDDMETAHNLGIRQGTYTAAALIRPALAALGFEAPAGVAICQCCGRDHDDGHDPDCDCDEDEDEDEGDEEADEQFINPAPAEASAAINEALGGPLATPERIAATEDEIAAGSGSNSSDALDEERLREAGGNLADILEDVIGTHIYDHGEEPADAPERRAVKAWRDLEGR